MTATWTFAARRGEASLVARLWWLWLPLAAGVYLLCADSPSPKQLTAFLLVIAWGAAAARHAPRRPYEPGQFSPSQLVRQIFSVFFASASMLPLLTDFDAPTNYWIDIPAAVMAIAGLGLTTGFLSVARLPRRLWGWIAEPRNTGHLLFWIGIYLAAVSSPSGYLTLFAPLLVYKHYRALGRVLQPVIVTGADPAASPETFTTQAQWTKTGS